MLGRPAVSASLMLTFLISSAGPGVAADAPRHRQKIEELIRTLPLEAKLGQLTQQWGGEVQDTNPGARQRGQDEIFGIVRAGIVGSFLGAHGAEYTNKLQRIAVEEAPHGIPILLGNDVIHGYRTIFPIPLAEAATWDLDLIERACHVAATEARAAGTHWTFAPMIDVARDPRWGRIAETAGEDPFLGAQIAAARVRGFQGPSLAAPDRVLACAKHFVAYGAAEGGRDYNTVDISLPTLRSVHLPPFKAALDAGVRSFMTSFNEINGVPATANPLILDTILRKEWRFDGLVVSDWTSITEMIAHGFAADPAHAAELALPLGVDLDMCSFSYRDHGAALLKAGRIRPEHVDNALRHVLQAKAELGLFDHPYTDVALEPRVILAAEHRAVARTIAARSMVLLKNEGGLLPLTPAGRKLAVIGPLAESRKDPLGTWAGIGKPEDVVTVVEGLRAALGEGATLEVAAGSEVRAALDGGIAAAVQLAQASDVVVLVIGESEDMSGEGHSRSDLGLPAAQQALAEAVVAAGKPVVAVVLAGRPLTLPWLAEHAQAILYAWHPGVECGHAVADVLFGVIDASGKLPATFPRSVGQIPIYYNHKNTGRPPTQERYTSKYIDLPVTPQYPFGFGLSYTTFEFSKLAVSPATVAADGTVEVSVEVANTGARAGDETVQLYLRDPVGSVTRPVRELRGFQRVELAAGGRQTVTFRLTSAEFGFFDRHGNFVVEPGEIQVFVGPDSTASLTARFEIVSR